jgi:hypothetical protein
MSVGVIKQIKQIKMQLDIGHEAGQLFEVEAQQCTRSQGLVRVACAFVGAFKWSYIPSSAGEGTWTGFWFPKSPFTKSAMSSRLWARLMGKNGLMKVPRCERRRGWRRTWKARIGALTSIGPSVNGIRDLGSTAASVLHLC